MLDQSSLGSNFTMASNVVGTMPSCANPNREHDRDRKHLPPTSETASTTASASHLQAGSGSVEGATESSQPSSTRQLSEDNRNRRFSNLSNLAQSLPSTSSSASALAAPAAGSIDFLTSQAQKSESSRRRRRQSKGNKANRRSVCSRDDDSATDHKTSASVRRTQSALETATASSSAVITASASLRHKHHHHLRGHHDDLEAHVLDDYEEFEDSVEEEEEEEEEERSPHSPLLMKRHQSLDEQRSPKKRRADKTSMSSRSLDRYLSGSDDPESSCNSRRKQKQKQSGTTSVSLNPAGENHPFYGNVDMSTFEADLAEATEALLRAQNQADEMLRLDPQQQISGSFSSSPRNNSYRQDRRDSGPYLSMSGGKGGNRFIIVF